MSKSKVSDEVKLLAEQYDVNIDEIQGSGEGGTVTLDDVEKYIYEKFFPKIKEKIKIRGIRKTIASNLQKSYSEKVHVTLNMEVEVTNLERMKTIISTEMGIDVSYTLLYSVCTAAALREHPQFNATFENDELTIYDDININIAVDTQFGLVTPVLRNVDKKNLKELYKDYMDIVQRARDGKLKERDFVGGTFTVTNLGMFGVDFFNPIINYPQIAILGINRSFERKGEAGKFSFLSLSFDHRAVDGAPAARFLRSIKKFIEAPEEAIKL